MLPRLLPALGIPLLLALLQQQWLLQRPPQLRQIGSAMASAGPASLQLRFSRPLPIGSLERLSRLSPPLAHRWLGRGDSIQLALSPGQRLTGPLRLELAGRDPRGLALPPSTWRWDPRARVVAVVPAATGGEQLQLREHDGRWRPLGPVVRQILQVEPLGNGSGLAFTTGEDGGWQQAWRLALQQRDPSPADQPPPPLAPGRPERLAGGPEVLFIHLSADRRGGLLVQSGGLSPRQSRVIHWLPAGGRERLDIQASGPLRLLPDGGAVVVPDADGLSLRPLPPRPPRPSVLPGRRDLAAVCPLGGRALLVRHWPDYRRSLELVEPGRSPRQLWIGSAAVVAAACAGGADRLWVLLLDGERQPTLTLAELSRAGTVRRRRPLTGWELEPGAALQHDPASDQLLTVLRPLPAAGAPPPAAQAVLIDPATLAVRPLERPARLAVWLPPG